MSGEEREEAPEEAYSEALEYSPQRGKELLLFPGATLPASRERILSLNNNNDMDNVDGSQC